MTAECYKVIVHNFLAINIVIWIHVSGILIGNHQNACFELVLASKVLFTTQVQNHT